MPAVPADPDPLAWFHPTTPVADASMIPAISCPGTRGYLSPAKPSLVMASLWQMPHASTLTRTDRRRDQEFPVQQFPRVRWVE